VQSLQCWQHMACRDQHDISESVAWECRDGAWLVILMLCCVSYRLCFHYEYILCRVAIYTHVCLVHPTESFCVADANTVQVVTV
jgi:hypothetical protein